MALSKSMTNAELRKMISQRCIMIMILEVLLEVAPDTRIKAESKLNDSESRLILLSSDPESFLYGDTHQRLVTDRSRFNFLIHELERAFGIKYQNIQLKPLIEMTLLEFSATTFGLLQEKACRVP